MLKKLYQGHQDGESMVRRAREVMYWPGMQAGIIQKVSIAHYVPATVQRTLKNQCCPMRYLKAHGSSFPKTYSSREGDGMRLQLTISVIGLRWIC